MQDYHRIWLAHHCHRSEQWLKDRLKDGFDIHHIDGNKQNNEPRNLVLIESSDHMRLHGGNCLRRVGTVGGGAPSGPRPVTFANGQAAYHKRRAGLRWKQIDSKAMRQAMRHAKVYARHMGLPWPLPTTG